MKILQYATYVLGILGTLFLGASSYDVDMVTSSLHLTQATYCVDTANKNTWSCPTCDEGREIGVGYRGDGWACPRRL